MPRKLPDYVHAFRDRHGKLRTYFRRAGKPNIALPPVGSKAFGEAYARALAEHGSDDEPEPEKKKKRRRATAGTLGWLIDRYTAPDNPSWTVLAESTKDVYNRRFDWLKQHYGAGDLSTLTEDHVRKIRDQLKAFPSVADATVDRVGTLWGYAKEHLSAELKAIGMRLGPNPTAEVASIHTSHEQHKAWPPELCAAIEALAQPRLVLAYFLLRYTGQRRSDVVRMTWARFDGTAVDVVQQKTGTYCWIPAHPRLLDRLAATPRTGDYILMSERGGPYRATSLTNLVCSACAELGYAGYSAHGLRHLAGAALAEAGCSPQEIMAILGHLTEKQANEYCRQARRKVMAKSAMVKWVRGPEGG